MSPKDDNCFYYANLIHKKQKIFLDKDDFHYFTKLFEKHLTDNLSVDLIAYYLRSDSLGFLLYQSKTLGLKLLLKNLIRDYKSYYVKKYGEIEIDYRSFCITNVLNSEVLEISRKIHTDSECWRDCEFSSIRAYLYDDRPEWLSKQYLSSLYDSTLDYFNYLNRA